MHWKRPIRSFASLAAGLLLGAPAARALQVPLLVQELLPSGTASLPRTAEPVSVGVPLDPDDAITDVRQLGVRGASAAQFRVLQRDAATQAIRWVLVDLLAECPGGDYALVSGQGNFGGPDLATDAGDRIRIVTGVASFEIRKRGFDLLDGAWLGGDSLVRAHAGGGVVMQSGATRYESARDSKSVTEIEENGPVKTVVRSTGTLRSASGDEGLDYTARLHFYRGQSTCRLFVTLRNARQRSTQSRHFDAAWVEVPLRLAAARRVRFGVSGATCEGSLGPREAAYLFQGDNTFQRSPRTKKLLPELTPAVGLEVGIGTSQPRHLGNAADVSRGWMSLADGQHAVLAGMRDLATLFPSGFDVRDSTLAIELFSRHNPRQNLLFSWGAHETREILLDFTTTGSDAEAFRYALQYPLFGRCSFARYRDTGALNGERRLVSEAEERRFFAQQHEKWSVENYSESQIELARQYSFSTTGGPNQFDQDECHLLDFLRTGYGGRFLQGRLGVLWKADQAVLHSDDFDLGARANGVGDLGIRSQPSFHGKGAGNLFDDEHPHWVCMLHYYHMTGDENLREAIEDYGEWRLFRAGNPKYGALHGGGLKHFRMWSRCLRDVALLYEQTGQKRYLDGVHDMAQTLTRTVEQGNGHGRNLERGYFFFGDENNPLRNIHLFFLTEMNAIGVQEAMRVLPANDPWKEELRDYLYGMAYFTREAQVTADAPGYPYNYASTQPNPPGKRGDQTGIVLTHGYEMSGDPEFLRRSRALAYHVLEYQSRLRGSELSTHVRIYRWLHRDERGAVLLDPQVGANSDGSYTLDWTAPAGAREYIVKYGPRPLVENLGFDPVARTYEVDPSKAMNFWAASNVAGEPAPGPSGSPQRYTTPRLPRRTWYFKVKVLLGTDAPSTDEAEADVPASEEGVRARTPVHERGTPGRTPARRQPRANPSTPAPLYIRPYRNSRHVHAHDHS